MPKSRTENVAADGGIMPIYVSEPDGAGKAPAVIVYMEAFGVNGHIKKVADQYAKEGFLVISPDMYYRYGTNTVVGYNEIPKIMPMMQGMHDIQTSADIRIAIQFLKHHPRFKGTIGTVGYCMGGTLSWLSACWNRDVKAASVYYGGGIITRQTSEKRPVSPHNYAPLLTAPVLGCFGETDQNPPPADVKEVDALLTKLGKVHDFKIYPGAGHGFNCDERPSYQKAAADDAYARTLAWFKKYL